MNPITGSFEAWLMRGLVLALLALVTGMATHIWNNHNREDKRRMEQAERDIAALKTQGGQDRQVIVRLETTLERLEKEFTGIRTSLDAVNQNIGRVLVAITGAMMHGKRRTDLQAEDSEG